jgi:hypothetical protein
MMAVLQPKHVAYQLTVKFCYIVDYYVLVVLDGNKILLYYYDRMVPIKFLVYTVTQKVENVLTSSGTDRFSRMTQIHRGNFLPRNKQERRASSR